MFQEVYERVTKELTASAPSAMKIRAVAPPDGEIITVGAKRFRCVEVLLQQSFDELTARRWTVTVPTAPDFCSEGGRGLGCASRWHEGGNTDQRREADGTVSRELKGSSLLQLY